MTSALVLALIIAAFGVVGAGLSTHGLVLAPEDGPLLAASERAAAEWARYGESVSTSRGATVRVRWNPDLNLDGTPVAAAVYAAGDRIDVNSALYRPDVDCLWCAIFHEIGHLLGYDHGDDHYGLLIPIR